MMRNALLAFLCVALIPAIMAAAIMYYALARTERSKMPNEGVYYCEELDATLSFNGDHTFTLTLQDGIVYQLDTIANTGQLVEAKNGTHVVTGLYNSYLKHGYIDVKFTALPVDYEEDVRYRFVLLNQQ